MPTSIVRYLAILVALLGIVMLVLLTLGRGSSVYTGLRVVHILLALGLIGIFEASLARTKRAGQLNPDGQPVSMTGRIAMTLALLIGLFLLGSLLLNWISGSSFNVVVYIHALVGLIGVVAAGVLFTRRFVKS